MRSVTLLLIIVLSAQVSAKQPQTVKLTKPGAQGSGVLCGGTKDNRYRVILSVAHVTGTRLGTQMTLTTIDGRRQKALLVGADRKSDSALLVTAGRGLRDIPNARLWMQDIDTSHQLRTEGFTGSRFVTTVGRPSQMLSDGLMQWSSATYPGMSGGPTYVADTNPPRFLTTTTGSDFRTFSVGPYRTWFVDWVPTVKAQNFQFTCNSAGLIQMAPRGRLEDPIVIPEAPPVDDSRTELLEELRDLLRQQRPAEPTVDSQSLKSELADLLKPENRPAPAGPQRSGITVAEEPEPTTQPAPATDSNGQIVEVQIPVKLRIRVHDERTIQVEHVNQ